MFILISIHHSLLFLISIVKVFYFDNNREREREGERVCHTVAYSNLGLIMKHRLASDSRQCSYVSISSTITKCDLPCLV